jgi:hypothetical protein
MSCIWLLKLIVEKQSHALKEEELESAKFVLDAYYNSPLAKRFSMILGLGGYILSHVIHKIINFERKKK